MSDLYFATIKTLSLDPADPPMIAIMAVLFFIFWKFLMERSVFLPQMQILDDRISATEGLRLKASTTTREANALMERYDTRLSEVRAEAFGFKNGELSVARSEANQIIAKAEGEAEKILAASRSETDAFVQAARGSAKSEVESLAHTMASSVKSSLSVH